MSSTNDRNPSEGPPHRRARAAVPPARSARDMPLPIDTDDRYRVRRMPPAPLADILGDIDPSLAERAAPPHIPQQQQRQPLGAAPQQQRQSQPLGAAPQQQRQSQHLGAAPHPAPRKPLPARDAWERERDSAAPADLYLARMQADRAEGDLARVEHHYSLQHPLAFGPTSLSRSFQLHRPGWMVVIFVASVITILLAFGGREGALLSNWGAERIERGSVNGLSSALTAPMRPAGDYVLRAPPSLTAEQIDRILATYSSPATGTGQSWYNLGLERGIDPAYAVAFFIHESTAGTAQGWAGLKPDGSTTHNVGNIICAGYASCYGRFRDYPSWEAGIADWYRLIDVEYLNGRGHQTVADIIPVYAPAFENDVNGYVNVVQRLVDQWRSHGVP